MSADRPPHDRRRDTHAEEVLELAGAPRELFARMHRAHPEMIIDLELASVTGDATTPEPEDQQPEAQRRPDGNPGRGDARQRSAITAPTTRTTTTPGSPADRNDTMGPAR